MKYQTMGVLAMLALIVPACGPSSRPSSVSRGLDDYIRLARSAGVEGGEEDGSVWSDRAGYGDAFRDVKARRPADIVTVQVLESTSAVSEASTETAKSSSVDKQYTSLAGLEGLIAELPNLVDISQSSQFSGDASTSRRSVLSTTLTARVVEVFPNGNLLIEGNRELVVNGERQIVTLRGVVRPTDVSMDNIVLSSRIAEMELEVSGRGLISDAQNPGVLYRILSGIWPF
jgi:flagellar L-ring protein FlgH